MTNLETLISRRLMHVEVLSHQRRWINYNIRDVLRVGQGFIQADFVSLYNSLS